MPALCRLCRGRGAFSICFNWHLEIQFGRQMGNDLALRVVQKRRRDERASFRSSPAWPERLSGLFQPLRGLFMATQTCLRLAAIKLLDAEPGRLDEVFVAGHPQQVD